MENFHRAKIEKIDKDATHIMRIAQIKVEGKMTRLRKSTQNRKLRASAWCWTRRKEGKHESRGLIQKCKDMDQINKNQDIGIIVTKEELRRAKDDWDKHVKK